MIIIDVKMLAEHQVDMSRRMFSLCPELSFRPSAEGGLKSFAEKRYVLAFIRHSPRPELVRSASFTSQWTS